MKIKQSRISKIEAIINERIQKIESAKYSQNLRYLSTAELDKLLMEKLNSQTPYSEKLKKMSNEEIRAEIQRFTQ